jgi:hypothetical protein
MNIGMLWFDSDHQRDLGTRIERAVDYYRNKYKREPNLCFIHPSTSKGDAPDPLDGVKIRTSISVLPDHFWLGVEDTPEATSEVLRAAA